MFWFCPMRGCFFILDWIHLHKLGSNIFFLTVYLEFNNVTYIIFIGIQRSLPICST